MMLPGLIYLIANNYIPMFGILIALKKINSLWAFCKAPGAAWKTSSFCS